MGNELAGRSAAASRGEQAERLLQGAFQEAGWRVEPIPSGASGRDWGDFIARKQKLAYLVEVKAVAEARGDRLIPLWSQGWLQALRAAGTRYRPLVVIAAPHVPSRVAQQVLDFAAEYAPEGAAGVIDFEGLRRFRGDQLERLNHLPPEPERRRHTVPHGATNRFSDLNQWMLKVLLAPLVPERFLVAPRGEYANARELATAAKVSPMSAFRLVRALKQDGYLDERNRNLRLVRRSDLLHRWQSASAARRVKEVPMRFLHRSQPQVALDRLFRDGARGSGCLALFAAADALGVGFVKGVPPHMYLPRLDASAIAKLSGVVPAAPGESPDLLLRQPGAPRSVFRGVVRAKGMPVSDILQVWLGVSSEPARGEEQAAEIRRRILQPLFDE